MILCDIGNPWDYLNGTSHAFGISAGGADKVIVGMYNYFYAVVASLSVILILASVVEMILALSSQKRAQAKEKMFNRFLVLFLLGFASGFLTFLMKMCDLLFGIS